MPKRPLGVLSIGVLVVVLAISVALHATAILYSLSEALALTILLFGVWVMILAGIRASSPETYGHGAFNILSGGVLISALGVVWFLYLRDLLIGYLLPVLLAIIGVLVVVAGIRAWRK
ncbi:MAG: hypothetical protein ACE5L6_01945 [Candidatus Bathyarchaeia archaeon]